MSKNIGEVIALFISNSEEKKRIETNYIKVDRKGIQEDKYYNKEINRSVLITSIQSYRLLESHGINAKYGSLGENLLIDYNPYHLTPGTELKIGSTILEISQYCTICNHLETIDIRVPKLLEKDRGIFAQVIQEGYIKKEDAIFLI